MLTEEQFDQAVEDVAQMSIEMLCSQGMSIDFIPSVLRVAAEKVAIPRLILRSEMGDAAVHSLRGD